MRMTAAMKNARYVADFLAEHPKVQAVHYLGHLTEDSPMFDVYQRQCAGAGLDDLLRGRGRRGGGVPLPQRALQLVKLAVSLGGTESLAEHPGSMTHADVPPADQARMGIHARAGAAVGGRGALRGPDRRPGAGARRGA